MLSSILKFLNRHLTKKEKNYYLLFFRKGLHYVERFRAYDFVMQRLIRSTINKYGGYPKEIVFPLTYQCNSDCIMCPLGKVREGEKGKPKIMPMGLFKKIIADIDPKRVKLLIFTGGEPLLDPYLFEKIKIAKETMPDVPVSLFTNGSLLHKQNNIERLFDYPLKAITVSFDGVTEDVYEGIRRNLSFKQLKENVNQLYAAKKRLNSQTKIVLSFLSLKDNEDTYLEMIEQLSGSADNVIINKPHNFGGLLKIDEDEVFKSYKRYPCTYLWLRMSIKPDGMVSVCGFDYKVKYKAGDLNINTINEVWNSEEFIKARKQHLDGNFDAYDMCKDCTSHILWWSHII